jgi:hypothetical protein
VIGGSVLYLLLGGLDLATAAEQLLNGMYTSFLLLAIPLFILAAEFMTSGAIREGRCRRRAGNEITKSWGSARPAAFGVKLAHPDRTLVALASVGGIGENPAMLAAAVEQILPVSVRVCLTFDVQAAACPTHMRVAAFGPSGSRRPPKDLTVARAVTAASGVETQTLTIRNRRVLRGRCRCPSEDRSRPNEHNDHNP